jgi:hypothetical protein
MTDVRVRREPTEAILLNMAVRNDHGLGCPGYYDQPIFGGEGVGHARRLEAALTTMRQLYEEVVLAASPQGEGSSADADSHCAAEGVVLDASQIKAVEHAAMDAGAHSWRRARLAMVEDGQIIGYPVFSRADMAELARLYRVTEGVKP